ncbi:hypothetical protein HYQ46_005596 [Verticillium longisporum]|nr:hypothetical protein HYQ46_005596 [Verticillium longisporum]
MIIARRSDPPSRLSLHMTYLGYPPFPHVSLFRTRRYAGQSRTLPKRSTSPIALPHRNHMPIDRRGEGTRGERAAG